MSISIRLKLALGLSPELEHHLADMAKQAKAKRVIERSQHLKLCREHQGEHSTGGTHYPKKSCDYCKLAALYTRHAGSSSPMPDKVTYAHLSTEVLLRTLGP